MDSIKYWFYKHGTKISWFIIGFMTWQGLDDLARGNLTGAAFSFGIAFLNYILSK
jgi:hypothetical protein